MVDQADAAGLPRTRASFTVRTMHRPLARLACLALLLLALPPALALDDVALHPQKVAEGVYTFVGTPGEISTGNEGFVANGGFIVGPSGVVVVDTGTSYRHGRRMLDAIAKITDKPVELVILTHAVQDFIFGNAAFAERGIPILAHRETAKLMKARCDHCLENLRAILGDQLAGTKLVLPQREIDSSTTVEAGGRTLDLLFFGWASTPGDIVVRDKASGVLFAGGMVSIDNVPDIRDSDFEGWQRALGELKALQPVQVVPGHGPVSGIEAIAATAGYLDALDGKMKALYAESTSLMDSVEKAALPAYSTWPLYATTHRQNALHRYLQLELQELGGDPRSTALPSR
ncbi:MAG TPA: MBL fold metallo-hydrolase [Burkholderiales bacterium]|nr:MBL fold metallo-hydrolase [Burkholderiales bacterium]